MSTLVSGARTMAFGTIASRGTGFLRTAVVAGVLGVRGVGDAFNLANTAPNIVYDLLLGGVLSSVVVPLLVRAAKQDGDAGEAYTQRLLSLTVLVLGAASLLLVVFAPAVVAVYASSSTEPATRDLAIVFARFFLPQVLFYGAGAVMGAYLNTRGSFGPPMWAPVLNNVVVIITGGVFLLLPGPSRLEPGTVTSTQVTVLGIGVTLGIVAQTAALIPALRAKGFRFLPRLDLRGTGLSAAGRLARWVVLYVVANQIAYFVLVRLAFAAGDHAPGRGYSPFVNAYLLWQLPHAVVAVSIITALLPQMSRASADGRTGELSGALSRGLRLSLAVLVPAAVAYAVLGQSIATVVFAHGKVSVPDARFIGVLLAVLAVGLVPFSVYQLQLRGFYAMQDTRTPTLINIGVNVTMVVLDLVLYALLPNDLRVVGLAAGQSASFVVGLVVGARVLRRRTGAPADPLVVRTAVRCLLASLPPAALAVALGALVAGTIGTGAAGALATVAISGPVLLFGYLALVRRMRVPEVDEAIRPLLARFGR